MKFININPYLFLQHVAGRQNCCRFGRLLWISNSIFRYDENHLAPS